MASRYWVGGSGTWDASSTAHWSSSSGGSSGSSVPTSADDVHFVGSGSGGGVCTVSGVRSCRSLTIIEGVTNTTLTAAVAGSSEVQLSGSLYWYSGYSMGSLIIRMISTTAATLECSAPGSTLTVREIIFGGSSGTQVGPFTFDSGLTATTAILTHTRGTVDFNDENVSVASFTSSNSNTRTINMGSGRLTARSWTLGGSNLTFNKETSELRLNFSSGATFVGGGYSYNTVDIRSACDVSGNNTIASFVAQTANGSGGFEVRFAAGSTQSVAAATLAGTATRLLTLKSGTDTSQWTISKASGAVVVPYVSVRDSIATGGATFEATDGSTDAGNNSGWVFPTSPNRGGGFFAASQIIGVGLSLPVISHILGAAMFDRRRRLNSRRSTVRRPIARTAFRHTA